MSPQCNGDVQDVSTELRIGVNDDHNVTVENLNQIKQCGIIDEVSIGHAIMTDALKFGFSDTIMKYIKLIRNH
jgi:Pyridoxal phosphate biosynthesis protein